MPRQKFAVGKSLKSLSLNKGKHVVVIHGLLPKYQHFPHLEAVRMRPLHHVSLNSPRAVDVKQWRSSPYAGSQAMTPAMTHT